MNEPNDIFEGMLKALEASIDLITQYEKPRQIMCGKNSVTLNEITRIYNLAKKEKRENDQN